jgi:hypothetical protein
MMSRNYHLRLELPAPVCDTRKILCLCSMTEIPDRATHDSIPKTRHQHSGHDIAAIVVPNFLEDTPGPAS